MGMKKQHKVLQKGALPPVLVWFWHIKTTVTQTAGGLFLFKRNYFSVLLFIFDVSQNTLRHNMEEEFIKVSRLDHENMKSDSEEKACTPPSTPTSLHFWSRQCAKLSRRKWGILSVVWGKKPKQEYLQAAHRCRAAPHTQPEQSGLNQPEAKMFCY